VLFLGYGVMPYALAELSAYVASVLFCAYLLQRVVARPVFVFEPRVWLNIVQRALPFAIMVGLVMVYLRTDTVILSLIKGDTATGLYSVATKLLFSFTFLPASLVGAVLPAMSKQSAEKGPSHESLSRTFVQSFRFVFMLGVPIAVGIGILAQPIVRLMYGEEFIQATPAVQILMLTLVLTFLNWTASPILIAIDGERALMYIAAIGAAFNLVVNALLVSYGGYIGASVASVLSVALVLGLRLHVVGGTLGRLPLLHGLEKPALSGLVMALFLLGFRDTSVLILVAPAAAIYVGALFLFRTFDSDEMEMVRRFLPYGMGRPAVGPSEASGPTQHS
jgi:O-antigen/teichoic acid export membrane protein